MPFSKIFIIYLCFFQDFNHSFTNSHWLSVLSYVFHHTILITSILHHVQKCEHFQQQEQQQQVCYLLDRLHAQAVKNRKFKESLMIKHKKGKQNITCTAPTQLFTSSRIWFSLTAKKSSMVVMSSTASVKIRTWNSKFELKKSPRFCRVHTIIVR